MMSKRWAIGHKSRAVRISWTVALATTILALASAEAQAQSIAAFKDHLFQYGQILESRDEGRFQIIDYNEIRDVNGRDEIPVKKAKPEYVSMDILREQKRLSLRAGREVIDTFEVGSPRNAKLAVIFIHGAGGNATLGSNDWTFSGNFNRLKNLTVNSGGVYYSPSAPDFDSKIIGQLVNYIRTQSPDAKVIVSCGSAGSSVCWGMANDREIAPKLSGILILGGFPYRASFEKSPAIQARVPIYYAHGTRDSVVGAKTMAKQYEKLRAFDASYPIRLTLFHDGIHGTPIRMIDWRDALTWMLEASRGN